MRVLVIGSGGREHALAWKVSQSPLVTELFCAPGNAGTRSCAQNVELPVHTPAALAVWAVENKIDLTIVGPEEPLSIGIVDTFEEHGLRIFGPTKEAARLEASKSFAKEIMLKSGVRTAAGGVFTDFKAAKEFVLKQGTPIVIKADGLAAGKGVVVADNEIEAINTLEDFMVRERFGASGATVVIEEKLTGQEASVIAIVDGETVLPLVVSQDYKRLRDGDYGPNTGGMGAISPTPVLGEKRLETLVDEIFIPVVAELRQRGIRYRGFLYAGVMVDAAGNAWVLEFNCRLGDPETQVLMMRLQSDLVPALDAATRGKLNSIELRWKKEAAVCVVLASAGYPVAAEDKKLITGLFEPEESLIVFHAGTKVNPDDREQIVSSGGRILGVTASGENINAALKLAYQGVEKISFEGKQFRKDIGGGVW